MELMMNRLSKLNWGVDHGPQFVLDIGAHKGVWTKSFLQKFPNCKSVMLEANNDLTSELETVGQPFAITLLSDFVKTVTYFKQTNNSYENTGNSIYRENTEYFTNENTNEIKTETNTLDNILKAANLDETLIDLIKLDVQGSELDILRGGLKAISKANFILLEVSLIEYNIGSPLVADVMEYMSSIGFVLHDIVGALYGSHTSDQNSNMDSLSPEGSSNNQLFQSDFLFRKLL